MRRLRCLVALAIAMICVSPLPAKYKIKEIKVKPAREYPAHQDFQKITIAADPCDTEEKTIELFDTDKLHKKQIMPVLLVIENNNDFAIRLHEKGIFFVASDDTNFPAMSYVDVLLHISMRKPLTSISTRREVLIHSVGNKEMVMDFEHKAFGEKLIAPHSSDYGVVFFPLPEEEDLAGTRLYLPGVYNVTEDEEMMFFEFELAKKTDE